ncbi:hypothetical protein [Cerasicoccus maritimus]|uniref:hypothetical protein n=1 Tax=Cerasicoccus maritimus TaxID=490089 RepID=UPI00285282CA|nr:hypothetical protein [Cerasicoccus maritimus]
MKFHRPLFALFTFSILAVSLWAETEKTSSPDLSKIEMPVNGELDLSDLVAANQISSGELQTHERFGQYTEEEIETFLNQYVGVWEGYYNIQTLRGQTLTLMETRSTYEWDLVGKTRVLKNQSVYASGDKIAFSASLTYFWFGRVVTEVEQDGVKRIFLGYLSPDGKSITWNVANAVNKLSSSTTETFTQVDGRPAIQIEAYEEIRDAMSTGTIAMKGELKQVDRE